MKTLLALSADPSVGAETVLVFVSSDPLLKCLGLMWKSCGAQLLPCTGPRFHGGVQGLVREQEEEPEVTRVLKFDGSDLQVGHMTLASLCPSELHFCFLSGSHSRPSALPSTPLP